MGLELFVYGDGVAVCDTEHFRKTLKQNIGNYTFQEAFDRTGRILNIIVAPVNGTDPPRLLNYLTAPHVMVWSAAAVSSAAPGIFGPGYLYVRQSDGSERPESSVKWYDGSVEKDLPMEQLAELFNINHFLVSQVNPQAALLSSISLPPAIWNSPFTSLLASLMLFFKSQVRAPSGLSGRIAGLIPDTRVSCVGSSGRGAGTW
jgi:TAG lipase / steryl ester hydrolase / phospholipase A2 / LPA acyltransferase